MKTHTFNAEQLNIGGSIEALLHSYVTETPLIIDSPRPPVEIEKTHPSLDFSFLGFKKRESIPVVRIWERLSFLLSMGGFVLFPDSIESIRSQPNELTVITRNMKRVVVGFNKLRRFDTKLTGFTWIYDWFAVRSGGKHELDFVEDENDLVRHLVFYPSQRAGVRGTKDVVAVSYAKSDETLDMQYSEGYVTLKSRRMMQNAGIRGTSKGLSSSGDRRYEPIRIEHMHRELKEQLIPDITIGQILDLPRTNGELCTLTKKLFRQQMHSI